MKFVTMDINALTGQHTYTLTEEGEKFLRELLGPHEFTQGELLNTIAMGPVVHDATFSTVQVPYSKSVNLCLAKATDDMPIFVLLPTDPDAPGAVRDWARRYIERKAGALIAGGPTETREQRKYLDALKVADVMDHWRRSKGIAKWSES